MTDELQRIRFLVKRDGEPATREWVERTLSIYREALAGAGNHPRPRITARSSSTPSAASNSGCTAT